MSMTFERYARKYDIRRGTDRWAAAYDAWDVAQAQCAAGEWQSIEAAPKCDGVDFLLADTTSPGFRFYVSSWSRCTSRWIVPCWFKPTHFARLHEVQP